MYAIKITLTSLILGLYACSAANEDFLEQEESRINDNANMPEITHKKESTNKNYKNLSLFDSGLNLTSEQELCVDTYPNLKAENIRAGVTIGGVEGTATVYPLCSETVTSDCVTTSAYPAVNTEGLAAKVVAGQTLAGVAGTVIAAKADCSAGNQSDCIATSTYKTIDLSSKDAGGALDLSDSNFSARMASSSTFEYWDEDGNRHTNTGDADLAAGNIKSGVDILGTSGTTDPLNCASISAGTWIFVPGDPDYGTNDFCVMKYEAKCALSDGSACTASITTQSPTSTAANTPWNDIEQYDARTECASLGKGYHLLTNDEWMTIAANVTNVGSNWSGGVVGAGNLFRGHSDNDPASPCAADSDDSKAYVETDCTAQAAGGTEGSESTQRRTMTLSNGEVIWDLAGNLREWVDYFNDEEKPTPNDTTYRDYTDVTGTATLPLSDLIPTNAVKSFWVDSWDKNQGVGQARTGADSGGGGLTRGGGYSGGDRNGIFRMRIDQVSSASPVTLGFRCATTRP